MNKLLKAGKNLVGNYQKIQKIADNTKKVYNAGRNFQKLIGRMSELREEITKLVPNENKTVNTYEVETAKGKKEIKHDKKFLDALDYYMSREFIQSLENETLLGECYQLLSSEQKSAFLKKLEVTTRKAFNITEQVIAEETRINIEANKLN